MRDKKTVTMPKSEYDAMVRKLDTYEEKIRELNDKHEEYLTGKVLVLHEYLHPYLRETSSMSLLEGTEEFEKLFKKIYGIGEGKKDVSKALADQLTDTKQLLRNINLRVIKSTWGNRLSTLKDIRQMIEESGHV